MELLIRPALLEEDAANDLEAMYALDLTCFAEEFRFKFGNLKRYARMPGAVALVAESPALTDGLAGLVIVQLYRRTGNAYVVTLDVAPAVRRMGVASRLMHAAEQAVRASGARRIDLHVYTGNDGAVRFYERHGYVRETRERNLYGAGLDGWVYRKELAI